MPTSAVVGRFLDNGTLDPAFGSAGVRRYGDASTKSRVGSLGLQTDQKLVAVVHVLAPSVMRVLARYNPDGSLDPSFAGDGLVDDLPMGSASVLRIEQAAGRVVVGSETSGSPGVQLLRYWL